MRDQVNPMGGLRQHECLSCSHEGAVVIVLECTDAHRKILALFVAFPIRFTVASSATPVAVVVTPR